MTGATPRRLRTVQSYKRHLKVEISDVSIYLLLKNPAGTCKVEGPGLRRCKRRGRRGRMCSSQHLMHDEPLMNDARCPCIALSLRTWLIAAQKFLPDSAQMEGCAGAGRNVAAVPFS